MYEKYDVTKYGAYGDGGVYAAQTGFGWANGVVLALLEEFGWPEDLKVDCYSAGRVNIRADEIRNIIHEHIEQYNEEVKIVNIRNVLRDGVARAHGLDEVMVVELGEVEEGIINIALNLESNNVVGIFFLVEKIKYILLL